MSNEVEFELWGDSFEEVVQEVAPLVDNSSITSSEVAGSSPEVQLEYYENQMMAYLVSDFDSYRTQMLRLKPDFFRNENYILFSMLQKISSERGLSIDSDYLKVYLQSHKHEIALDTNRIEFDSFEADGLSGIDGALVSTVAVFDMYQSSGYIKEKSFDDTFMRFKNVFARLEFTDVLQQATTGLSFPIRSYRKRYVGLDGMLEFLGRKINDLKSLTSEENSYSMIDSSEIDFEEEDGKTPTLLTELEFIPTLNKAMKGIRTNTLVTSVAPEKGMKTKFAVRVSHSVLLKGHNICFWGKEGGSLKVRSELRAVHFDYYYNVLHGKNYAKISAQDIMMGTLEPELKELEKFSRMDLFRNNKYGKVFTPDYPFAYENLETVVREAGEDKNCRFMVIDYVQIMDSNEYRDDRVIIEKAYSKLESLKGVLDMCIWCPAQMSTEAVQAFGNGQHRELRNITAKSSEPTKSADVNILVYVNDDMSKKNVAKIFGLPSRYFGDFEPINVYTDKVANNLIELEGQTVVERDGEITFVNEEDVSFDE